MSRVLARQLGCGLAMLLTVGQAPLARAEAVGSPASILKKGRWAMGLVGGWVADRNFKGNAQATVVHAGHFRGYGLTDRLSLYGRLGGAGIEVDDPSIQKTDRSTTHSFGLNFAGAAQLKARVMESKRFGVEWDASAQYVEMRAGHKGKNEGRWHEGQLATGLAKSLGRFTPYAGVKFAMVDFVYKVRESGTLLRQDKYEQETPVGLYAGTDVRFGEQQDVILNVEGDYLDGLEVTVALAYTF